MTVDWLGPLLGAIGAFLAAWLGAHLGFRRSRKERALDRTITWHEQAIEALAKYEEQLEKLRKYSVQRFLSQPSDQDLAGQSHNREGKSPSITRVPSPMWQDLTDVEMRARALLRLADLYTDERLAIKCSVGLSNTVNLVLNHLVHILGEPAVADSSFYIKHRSTADLRRELQDSLRVTLEMDGALAGVLGARYRKWLKSRRIDKLRRDFIREQEAAKKSVAKSETAS